MSGSGLQKKISLVVAEKSGREWTANPCGSIDISSNQSFKTLEDLHNYYGGTLFHDDDSEGAVIVEYSVADKPLVRSLDIPDLNEALRLQAQRKFLIAIDKKSNTYRLFGFTYDEKENDFVSYLYNDLGYFYVQDAVETIVTATSLEIKTIETIVENDKFYPKFLVEVVNP